MAWIIAHWSQLGLLVSELLGLFGLGGVAKSIVDALWPKKDASVSAIK